MAIYRCQGAPLAPDLADHSLGRDIILATAADPAGTLRLADCEHCGGKGCYVFYAPDAQERAALEQLIGGGRLVPAPAVVMDTAAPAPPAPEPVPATPAAAPFLLSIEGASGDRWGDQPMFHDQRWQ